MKRMLLTALGLSVLAIGLVLPAHAQDQTYLSLQTASSDVQTGQEYTVFIRLDNVPELWMVSMEIAFDPSLIYVIGTQAGSPVTPGPFWTPGSALSIHNSVENDQIAFVMSQLAPADLLSGSGVIGTFRIYPLAPGKATLTIRRAELTTMTFTGEGPERVGSNPQPVPFTPALLELTITGDPVVPPSEATATPEPTATPTRSAGATRPPEEPTLANVTMVPGVTAAAVPPAATPEEQTEKSSSSTLLMVTALIAALAGVSGLLVVLRRSRSRRR